MKKRLRVLFLAAVITVFAAGCRSTLGPALELEEYRKNVQEFDYGAVYDEEGGYHYPGIAWSMTLDEIQVLTREAVTNVTGVDEAGNVVFHAEYLKALASGRKNSDAQVGTDANSVCNGVMLVYGAADLSEGEIGQSALYEFLVGKFTALYGAPDETKQSASPLNDGTKAEVEETIWTKDLSNGSISRMVVSKAYVSYTGEPDYVSIAFSNDR